MSLLNKLSMQQVQQGWYENIIQFEIYLHVNLEANIVST
jgi:hypothetical protein